MKKRKKITPAEAGEQLAGIIGKHLRKLPPAERRRRTGKAYKRLQDAMKRRPNKI